MSSINYWLLSISTAAACLASSAIFAGVLASLYGLGWYKNKKQNRKSIGKVEEDHNTKEPLAEQLA
jgi:hypothetical protein